MRSMVEGLNGRLRKILNADAGWRLHSGSDRPRRR